MNNTNISPSLNTPVLNNSVATTVYIPLKQTTTPSRSSSEGLGPLFKLVLIILPTLGIVCLLSILFVVIYWTRRRRRMLAVNLRTEDTNGAYHTHGLTYSLKRTFSDGPLYAVTNLNGASHTSNTNNNENGTVNHLDDKIVYERYLTPVDGPLPTGAETSLNSTVEMVESDYLEPVTGVPDDGSKAVIKHAGGQESNKSVPKPGPKQGMNKSVKTNMEVPYYEEVTPHVLVKK